MIKNVTLSPFFRGDTKTYNLSFMDKGVPINITGHELWFTMKKRVNDADEQAIIQKRLIFPSGPESGRGMGTLTLTSAETKWIDPDVYFYDMQKVIPENPPRVETVVSGKITVMPDVTRNDGSV